MTLRTGYYLIKSLSSDEGYLGVGANSSDDRRIVVLHPEAMNLKWFIKEELSGLYTIKNGNAIANLDDGLTVSVFPSNSKKGDWNIIPRKKYGANVYTIISREDDAGWILPSDEEDIQVTCEPLTCHLTDKKTFPSKELWALTYLEGMY